MSGLSEKQLKKFMKRYNLKKLNEEQMNWIRECRSKTKSKCTHILIGMAGSWIIRLYNNLVKPKSIAIEIISYILLLLICCYVIRESILLSKITKEFKAKFQGNESKYKIK